MCFGGKPKVQALPAPAVSPPPPPPPSETAGNISPLVGKKGLTLPKNFGVRALNLRRGTDVGVNIPQ